MANLRFKREIVEELLAEAGTHIEAVTGVFYFHLCLVKFAYVFCCQIFAIYTAIYKSDSHNSSFLVLLYWLLFSGCKITASSL